MQQIFHLAVNCIGLFPEQVDQPRFQQPAFLLGQCQENLRIAGRLVVHAGLEEPQG